MGPVHGHSCRRLRCSAVARRSVRWSPPEARTPHQKDMQKLHRFAVKRMENPWRLRLGCRGTIQSGINRRQRMAHNSPYERPSRHWELVKGIPTQVQLAGRRESQLITPIPKPRKRGGKDEQRELEFGAQGLSDSDQQYEATQQINSI